jgi:type II secretory pathway pseudopilin PulG
MNNLIITIIGIALAAVATSMAVYYGGTAFEDGQAAAAANQMISNGQQIAAAFQLYSVANGGTTLTPGTSNNFDNDFNFLVTQGYLESQPTLPSGMTTTGNYQGYVTTNGYGCETQLPDYQTSYVCGNAAGFHGSGGTGSPTAVYVQVELDNSSSFNEKVCQKIANQSRGPSAAAVNTYAYTTDTMLTTNLVFDCAPSTHSGAYDFDYRII